MIDDEQVSALAQELYGEDGHAGSLYRQMPHILRYYENRALDLLEEEDD